MNKDKIIKGQFYTKKNFWFMKHINSFLESFTSVKTIIDPFAGDGDILDIFEDEYNVKGFDIDMVNTVGWEFNDSLLEVKHENDSFIVTNPPYLSRVSAKRKKINLKYFDESTESDLYKIALNSMLDSGMPGIAIVPETFINSKFPKEHIYSITILIPNPFEDTSVPVAVICFDPVRFFVETKIYKNDKYVGTIEEFINKSNNFFATKKTKKIVFNDPKGNIALLAYDKISGEKIKFMNASDLKYKREIKVSSRVVTRISIDNVKPTSDIIEALNKALNTYRVLTDDVLLSPFKGNDKNMERRRRLDYKTARKIIEVSHNVL